MTTTPLDGMPPAPVQSFRADLDLSKVTAHPNNPRRRATADVELIASVKARGLVQPLIVAPHHDDDTAFTLIAGHRRLDALKKAKRTTAAVVIRNDLTTEAAQLEAMLVENGRRKDLSPIEEAEGYQQLTLFGYKQQDIATAVGVDKSTVSSRIRLLKLQPSTQTKVHGGQITIDDALAIQSFADDPATTKRLERAAGTDSFKRDLSDAKRTRANLTKARSAAAEYADAGIPELPNPKGQHWWSFLDKLGAVLLAHTHSSEPADHDGCVAYFVSSDTWSSDVKLVCTNPDTHAGEVDQDEVRRQAEADKARAEREAADGAAEAARTERLATIAAALPTKVKLDPVVKAALAGLLSVQIARLAPGTATVVYQDLVDVGDDDRWVGSGRWHDPNQLLRLGRHRDVLAQAGDRALLDALVAVLVAGGEDCLGERPGSHYPHPYAAAHARDYLEVLRSLGHVFSDVDDQLLATATPGEDDQ